MPMKTNRYAFAATVMCTWWLLFVPTFTYPSESNNNNHHHYVSVDTKSSVPRHRQFLNFLRDGLTNGALPQQVANINPRQSHTPILRFTTSINTDSDDDYNDVNEDNNDRTNITVDRHVPVFPSKLATKRKSKTELAFALATNNRSRTLKGTQLLVSCPRGGEESSKPMKKRFGRRPFLSSSSSRNRHILAVADHAMSPSIGINPRTMTLPRNKDTSDSTTTTKANNNSNGATAAKAPTLPKVKIPHEQSLSTTEPFVTVESIADMNLGDIVMAFRYAIESTQAGFNEAAFFKDMSRSTKKVLQAMSIAVNKSRGPNVQPPETQAPSQTASIHGDIDALNYCAALRVFSEWRVVRLLPEGYKLYSWGLALGHKDIVGNLAKIEKAAHNWMDHQQQQQQHQVRSPTLRELLQFEIDENVHGNENLPNLVDNTAAVGLIWVKRHLHYQTAAFRNTLQVPSKFDNFKKAISAAYNEAFGNYHGWAAKKSFDYSLQAAPDADEIYQCMNPRRLIELEHAAQNGASSLLALSNNNHADDSATSPQSLDTPQTLVAMNDQPAAEESRTLNPFRRVMRTVRRRRVKCAGPQPEVLLASKTSSVPPVVQVDGGANINNNAISMSHSGSVEDIDELVSKEMEKDGQHYMSAYLEVAQPFLDDLSCLIAEFNMDDPRKL